MDLHSLALGGDAAGVVRHLQEFPHVVNHRAYGRTALHHACHRGHYDAARALLICGADPNFLDANHEETPLHIACTNGHTRVALLLCSKGARVNQPDGHYEWAALHHCAERGDVDTVRALLEMEQCSVDGHVAVDLPDVDGFTALHHSCINGFPDVAMVLLDHGANPHAQADNGWTIMHCAARRGLQHLMMGLVGRGVLLSVQDNEGRTALDIAHSSRVDKEKLQALSVSYWRNLRRKELEEKDIAAGKRLYIKPAKIADNKIKSKERKSVWAEDIDLHAPGPIEDVGDAALAMLAAKMQIGKAPKKAAATKGKK